jgi:hypothetical protein
VRISQHHTALLVWGQAAQTPFGTVSYTDKVTIGGSIRKALHV